MNPARLGIRKVRTHGYCLGFGCSYSAWLAGGRTGSASSLAGGRFGLGWLFCPRGAANGGLLEPLLGEGDYVVDGIAPLAPDQPVWNLKSPVSLTRWLLASYSQVQLDCCLGVDSLWTFALLTAVSSQETPVSGRMGEALS